MIQKIASMREIFREVDEDEAVFQHAVGLECLKTCGHCCENPLIETTVLEMLPLAADLLEQGTIEDFYQLAEKQGFKGRCVFFQPEPDPDVPGHCGIYEHRPLICRLFSSSGNADKHGHMRLVVCAQLKKAKALRFQRAEADALAGRLAVPVMANYMMRAMAIDPGLGRESFLLNTAFRKAAERVLVHQKFSPAGSSAPDKK